MDCTVRIAKTKALISFAVTAKLICVFVFAYAKSRFSHDAAHTVACRPCNFQICTYQHLVIFKPSLPTPGNLVKMFQQGELIVYQSSRRLSVCPSVLVCVHTFKHVYIRNQKANCNQILSEASLGGGKAASLSHFQR